MKSAPVTEYERPAFAPFTLTIESEAEAKELWHRLNVADATPYNQYQSSQEALNGERPTTLYGFRMWDAVNDQYKARSNT
jgi:hypothetical protein